MEEAKKEKEQQEAKEQKETKETKEDEKEKLKKEIEDWKKAYAIKLADFDNYKKRIDREFKELEKYACQDLILSQLSDLDILEKAIETTDATDSNKALLDGINMVVKNMVAKLKEMGVEEINNEGVYDPYQHHAISMDKDDEKEDGEILQVLQKGYKLKGKVIRPSMVKINKK
ncbi:nucleotide exchange factor GrpE [Sneathia vaginalis]|uniref:Protein GrpE n=1 Tax=Sneathia vaginalis TaxID=187101 RepID=A0A0E3ZBS9_9FUSO|nr:nucleotide exchange factor GrpE [Sneathia vaginalis]AKC95967.1 hypothetical protein VC03_05700 [Sneathia vaginalis]MBE2989103.1 nucleotide exchange factor GrpE [Sneathia sp. DSM 16630]